MADKKSQNISNRILVIIGVVIALFLFVLIIVLLTHDNPNSTGNVVNSANTQNQNTVAVPTQNCHDVQVPYTANVCNTQNLAYNVQEGNCQKFSPGLFGLGSSPATYTITVNNLDNENGGNFVFYVGFNLPDGNKIGNQVTQYIYPESSESFTYSSNTQISSCLYQGVTIPTKQVCQYVTEYKTETQCN